MGTIDITAEIKALQSGGTLKKTSGSYSINGTISNNEITVDLSGGSLDAKPDPTMGMVFYAIGGLTLKNMNITGAGTLVYQNGPNVLLENLITTGFTNLINTGPASVGTRIYKCNVGITSSVSIYSTGNQVEIVDNILWGSEGESPIRFEVKENTKTGAVILRSDGTPDRGVNAIIVCNKITNHNSFRKPAIQLRSVDYCNVAGNMINGDMRIGNVQTPPILVLGDCNIGCSVTNNSFTNPDTGVPPINVDQGCSVVIAGNNFDSTCNVLGFNIGIDANGSNSTTLVANVSTAKAVYFGGGQHSILNV